MEWTLICFNVLLIIGSSLQTKEKTEDNSAVVRLRTPRDVVSPVDGTFLYRFPPVQVGFYDSTLHTTSLKTQDHDVGDIARPRVIGAAFGAASTFITIASAIATANKDSSSQRMRAYASKGNDIVFHFNSWENIYKGGIFAIFRPLTGRALAWVWVHNASENTKSLLKKARSHHGNKMTLPIIESTIENDSFQQIAKVEKIKGYNYRPYKLYRQHGGNLYGLVLYLEDYNVEDYNVLGYD